MIWIRLFSLVFLLVMVLTTAADAGLTVVADHGGQPARPYYAPITSAGVHAAQPETTPRPPHGRTPNLPVHSSALTPGPVAQRAIHLPAGTTPFFLIGHGRRSRHWLKTHRRPLRKLHAVGLAVDIDNAAELRTLQRIGHGLTIRPTPGNDIAQRLHLAHYPVLITARAIGP